MLLHMRPNNQLGSCEATEKNKQRTKVFQRSCMDAPDGTTLLAQYATSLQNTISFQSQQSTTKHIPSTNLKA